MSWSIEEHIGEGRPWPEQVVVYRGETDESLTYARRSLSDVNQMVELMDTLAAENAKLREQIHWLKKGDILHVLTDQEYIDQCERERLMQVSIDALDKENAKLRELAAGIGHLLFTLDVDYCAICPRDDINHPCPVHTVEGGDCLYETDLRELGVEVDE